MLLKQQSHVPTTKWVEETYEEEETFIEEEVIMIPHKFGKMIEEYDLTELDLALISDMSFDAQTDQIIMMAESNDETVAILTVKLEDQGSVQLNNLIKISDPAIGSVLSKDPYTQNWIISADDDVRFYSSDGRLIRHNTSNIIAGFSDLCDTPVLAEDGSNSGSQKLALVNGQVGVYDFNRENESMIHHIPGEFETLEEAISQAQPEDWILVAPGTYNGNASIADKSINLGSYYQITEDSYFLENTKLTNSGGAAISLASSELSKLYVSGLTISDSDIGIQSSGNLTVENLEVKNNKVGFQLSGGMVMLSDSIISANDSHGLYYSDATATLVERCNINQNGGNGIQIDITPYEGVLFRTVIRRNDIVENAGSGIYFADDTINTQREFRIENNFIIKKWQSRS